MLGSVRGMIKDGSCAALSLDVFDTILWRRVPRPTDLFGLLAERLRRRGRCPGHLDGPALQRLRIAAEHDARMTHETLGPEISLFDIWRCMPLSFFGDTPLEELVAEEVELERALLVVDLDIADLVDLANEHNVPVVLVSDTWLTEDQLVYLLDQPELKSLHNAHIFRFHQHRTEKKEELWPVVLNELRIRAEQLVHIGDDGDADHEVPPALGVRTQHYTRVDRDFASVLEREQEHWNEPDRYLPTLDPEHGDFGLTSLRARTLTAAHRNTNSGADIAWRYGAGVLGPVLTGFAEWVAHRAENTGTRVVWCPMREGELLSTLVNNAAETRGWDVEARTLWLSRQVVSLAAVDRIDRETIHAFIRRSHQLTVQQLLDSLHLQPGEVPSLLEKLDTVLDNENIVDEVSAALLETPHLRNRLGTTTAAARERLLKALRQSGALDHPELTLVDLGWGATIQYHLAQALHSAGIDVTPAGLYLVTDTRSIRAQQVGLPTAGFLAHAGHPHEVAHTVSRSPEVLEQSVNAVCGSLIDFAEDGSPLLASSPETPNQDRERQEVQNGVYTFQRTWNRYVAQFTWPILAERARPHLANILVSALRDPTVDEARVFGNWQHEDNFGSTVVTRIMPDDLAAAIPYLSPNDLADLEMRDSFWPRLISASDTHLGAATRALDTGLLPPTVFDPAGEPFDTRMSWRSEDGSWHEGPRKRVRINHNGLSFARLTVLEHEVHHIHDVALALPGRPAVVRIDWIEAKIIAGGKPVVLRWQTPEDFAGLTLTDCIPLGSTMLEFITPDSTLWLPLAAHGGGPVSSVQISVAFAMLPRSRAGFEYRVPPREQAPAGCRPRPQRVPQPRTLRPGERGETHRRTPDHEQARDMILRLFPAVNGAAGNNREVTRV